MRHEHRIEAIVIGVSAGGVAALKILLGALPKDFPLPVMIVQHIAPGSGDELPRLLNDLCAVHVTEAQENEEIIPGTVYIASPNYHLLVEPNRTFSFSVDPPVCFARPSIDVLFESAARAYGGSLIGIILTGANFDGSHGLKQIKEKGGLAIVQHPDDAEVDSMPLAALAAVQPDYVLPLAQIAPLLRQLASADPTRIAPDVTVALGNRGKHVE